MKNWGDGAWHNLTTLMIALFLLIVPFGLSDTKFLWLSAGACVCLFINPDLDQDGLTLAETLLVKVFGRMGERIGLLFSRGLADTLMRIGKSFGQMFAGAWMFVWAFYSAFMPHRSFFSHFPIIGTLIRVAYLAGWVALYRHFVLQVSGVPMPVELAPYSMQLAIALAGLMVADFGHYARDMGWLRLEIYFGVTNKQSDT